MVAVVAAVRLRLDLTARQQMVEMAAQVVHHQSLVRRLLAAVVAVQAFM
jgi:hypothetical protein